MLKEVFGFTIDVLDYCEDLILIRKKVFADKIIRATLSATLCIQVAIDNQEKSKCLPAFKKAERDLGNTIHWLELCKKAPSYSEKQRNNLISTGTRIKKFCSERIKEHTQ